MASFGNLKRWKDEMREKLIFTDEHRQKLSDAAKIKTYTDEIKMAISEGKKGKPAHPNSIAAVVKVRSKNIIRIDANTGEEKEYISMAAARNEDGFGVRHIREACNNYPSKVYNGFRWRFKANEIEV